MSGHKKESDLMKSVKGMAWTSSSVVTDYIVNFITTFVLARLLTPHDYGEVAAITVLIGLADFLWKIGVGSALVQKKNLTDEDIATGQTLNILFGIFAFILINVFAQFWTNVFSISSVKMLRAYSFVFILSYFTATPQSVMQKKCKFKTMAFFNVASTVFYGVVAVIFAKQGFGPWALVYATVLRYAFKGILIYSKERIPVKIHINKESAKSIMFFSFGQVIAGIFNYIANNGDNFVINKMLNKNSLGTYTKAYSLIGYPASLVGESINKVMFPILADNQDNKEKLSKSFLMETGLVAVLSIPISIAMYFCADDLILFYLGENWGMVADCLRFMLLGLFFRIAYKICDTMIVAIGKVYQRSFIQIIYALLVVGGAYFGSKIGINGVAINVTIAFTTNCILMTIMCMIYLKINVLGYIKSVAGPCLYGFVTVIVAILIKPYYEQISNSFLACAIWTITVFGVYVAQFMLTRRFLVSKDINNALNTLIHSFKKKIFKSRGVTNGQN